MTQDATLRIIDDGAHDAAFNMAMDESLFRRHIHEQESHSILRFYRFAELARTAGIGVWRRIRSNDVVRRVTGGGVVCHGHDLTYSLIVPLQRHPELKRACESYRLIHQALQVVICDFGIPVSLEPDRGQKPGLYCFDAPSVSDLMLSDEKVVGGAQKRSFDYLLHQGSIAWNRLTDEVPTLSESEFRLRFAESLAMLLGKTKRGQVGDRSPESGNMTRPQPVPFG